MAVLRLHGRSGRERWRASFSLPNSARFDVLEQIMPHPSGDVVAIMYLGAEDGPDVVRVVRLDGRNGNDDDLDPFEGVVVSRDGRRGTDAQGSKAHGAHGHVPPGHRVP